MKDVSKIAMALECCIYNETDIDMHCTTSACPYFNECGGKPTSDELLQDILELLRSQIPRVLRPDELKEGMTVWIDQSNWSRPTVYEVDRIHKIGPNDILVHPELPSPLGDHYMFIFHPYNILRINQYGIKDGWIAWSEKPSSEQRNELWSSLK